MGLLIQTVCAFVPAAEVSDAEFVKPTFIDPDAVMFPQPPVSVTVNEYKPCCEGVPLMVTTLAAQEPETPAGKPLKVAPVAPVVL